MRWARGRGGARDDTRWQRIEGAIARVGSAGSDVRREVTAGRRTECAREEWDRKGKALLESFAEKRLEEGNGGCEVESVGHLTVNV
jgi:hypothetical protein